MKRRLLVLTLVSLGRLAVLAPIVGAQEATARPTVAIADVEVAPGGWTLAPPQLGAAIAQLLLDELVTSARFRVVDGQWLVPEAEANRGRVALDRLRANAAASQVDYLVLGTVTAFSTEQHARRGGGLLPRPFIAGGLARQETLTTVGVTFRIVDVRTGEVVTTTTAEGRGKRKVTALGLLSVVHGLPIGGGGSSHFSPSSRDAMLDEAVRDAVRGAAAALVSSSLRLTHVAPIERSGG
jgi:curli biogenesis system outer membrane secretion channel CsgG